MEITTIGIDLAKVVFQIHGVTEHGKAAVRKQLKRAEMAKYFANLEPCLTGMEACGGAVSIPPSRRLAADCLPLVPHWARLFRQYGHTVKPMVPKFVTPTDNNTVPKRNKLTKIACDDVPKKSKRLLWWCRLEECEVSFLAGNISRGHFATLQSAIRQWEQLRVPQ